MSYLTTATLGALAALGGCTLFLTLGAPRATGRASAPPPTSMAVDAQLLEGEARINEVLFDAPGPDLGTEWVEIASVGLGRIDLSGWHLEDENGTVLFTFQAHRSPAGSTTLIYLGPVLPTIAAQGAAASDLDILFLGSSVGNLLGDDAGGVVLVDAAGGIRDAFFWGKDTPPLAAAGYQAAVQAGEWQAGDYYPTTFDGSRLHFRGESAGRDRYARDSNQAIDWTGEGGANAAGCTPGQPNHIDMFNANRLVEHAHMVVDGAFLAYGSSPEELLRFSVESSVIHSIQVEDLPGLSWAVDADLTFNVVDSNTGTAAQAWSGLVRVEFLAVGERSLKLATTGTLQSPSGLELSFSESLTLAGTGTGTKLEARGVSYSLDEGTESYPLQLDSHTTRRWLSDTQLEIAIVKIESNWDGNAPKAYTSRNLITWVDDATTWEVFEMMAPTPPLPPALGKTLGVSGTLTTQGSLTRNMTAEGGFLIQDLTLEGKLDGVTLMQIGPAGDGQLSMARESGQQGDPVGSLRFTGVLPVFYPEVGGSSTFEFEEYNVTTIQSDKLITNGVLTLRRQGFPDEQSSRVIDPPVQFSQFSPPPRKVSGAITKSPGTVATGITIYGGGGGGGWGSGLMRVGGGVAIGGSCIAMGWCAGPAGAAAPATFGLSAMGWGVACLAGGLLWGEMW